MYTFKGKNKIAFYFYLSFLLTLVCTIFFISFTVTGSLCLINYYQLDLQLKQQIETVRAPLKHIERIGIALLLLGGLTLIAMLSSCVVLIISSYLFFVEHKQEEKLTHEQVELLQGDVSPVSVHATSQASSANQHSKDNLPNEKTLLTNNLNSKNNYIVEEKNSLGYEEIPLKEENKFP
ncbi:hypothetical protein ABK040_014353 [Willaertia magna]